MHTSGKLSEHVKVDVALEPVSLASTNKTGGYHSLKGYKRALFAFKAATIAATKTVVAQVMKAQDAVGTAAAALTGATATITANASVTKALLTAATIVDGDSTVTVNGTVFTCEDTTPDIDSGEFASGADDTAAAANLAAAINHLLGTTLLASAAAGVVTLTAKEPGEAAITITAAHATIVPSTVEALGYVEVDAAQLGSGFTHAALKLTTDATIVVEGTLVREGLSAGNAAPTQQVAASKVL